MTLSFEVFPWANFSRTDSEEVGFKGRFSVRFRLPCTTIPLRKELVSKSLSPSHGVCLLWSRGPGGGREEATGPEDRGPSPVLSPACPCNEQLPLPQSLGLPLSGGGPQESAVGSRHSWMCLHTVLKTQQPLPRVPQFPNLQKSKTVAFPVQCRGNLVLTGFLVLPLSLNCNANVDRNLPLSFSFLV